MGLLSFVKKYAMIDPTKLPKIDETLATKQINVLQPLPQSFIPLCQFVKKI